MTDPTPSPEKLAESVRKSPGSDGKRPLPPIQEFDIRIARDGVWYHRGTPFTRPALVKLFSTVLRREENGDYLLATPVERGRITVDDAPFVAVDLNVEGTGRDRRIRLMTNLDIWIDLDGDHPIRVAEDAETGEPSPYVLVRDGLEALITRAVFFDLAELAEERADGVLGLWSFGCFHLLGRAAA